MTEQAPDYLIFGEKLHSIRLCSTHRGFFDPHDHGIDKIYSQSTACWRGYIVVYNCIHNELVVDSLCLQIKERQLINGITPSPHRPRLLATGLAEFYTEGFNYYYENLRLKTDFSGDIIIDQGMQILESFISSGHKYSEDFRQPLVKIFEQQGWPSSILGSPGSPVPKDALEFIKKSKSQTSKLSFEKGHLISQKLLNYGEISAEIKDILSKRSILKSGDKKYK
ncbi:MAG: hypothetical protein JSV04_14500 [Candidatus Heimdallarchaeota archaeon]|nr:MAG: hypothetical protein JSV04_14500 [Candidatus Heimdallarchaeota archaeon]